METIQEKSSIHAQAHSGLEDMVATESKICFIDGPRTRLIYRGYSIEDLARHSTFEEVAYLLYFGKLPAKSDLSEFTATLAAARKCPDGLLDLIRKIPRDTHPMTALRTMISAAAFFDPETENSAYEANVRKAVRLCAQLPTLVAAFQRIRNGKSPLEPKKNLGQAANFLYMLEGREADPLLGKALDLYLVLLADHELNASTFACRVTASTLSDYYSAITSAVGALKGPLHGGANEQVIKMILEVGDPAQSESFIRKALAEKRKIMGFGHRVYKVRDPRSPILKEMAAQVTKKTGNDKLFTIAEKIEAIVTAEKKLPSNVDFYSAPLLHCAGVPADLFTTIFAMSRIAGWSAHYLEQVSDNRLIRPRAEYTGAMDLPYTPIEKR